MTVAARTFDEYALSDTPGWRDVDYQQDVRSLAVTGTPINFLDRGEGSPLVLLHGIGGCWQHWIQNIGRLAREHRVIAVDMPGFGGSPMLPGPVRIDRYARTLDALCEALGLGSVTLVGNSLGGLVSAKLAAHHPERVQRLVLVDAAGISTGRLGYGVAVGSQLAMLQFEQGITLIAKLKGDRAEHPVQIAVEHPRAFERGLLKAALTPGRGSRGFGPVAAHLGLLALRRGRFHTPEQITCPTLIVWGRQDRLLPVADADVLAEMISGSRVTIFEDCGHMPQLERPRDFNRLVLEFVREGER